MGKDEYDNGFPLPKGERARVRGAIASAIGRSARFFLVAGMIRYFGPIVREKIEKYFDWLALAFFALLIGGFLVARVLL